MIQHLGLELATDMNIMMRETLHNIDLKDVQRHILATASTTDFVHRATMNNSAMTPLYTTMSSWPFHPQMRTANPYTKKSCPSNSDKNSKSRNLPKMKTSR
jgi:hypothetical protein